jgi:hypothetical protein
MLGQNKTSWHYFVKSIKSNGWHSPFTFFPLYLLLFASLLCPSGLISAKLFDSLEDGAIQLGFLGLASSVWAGFANSRLKFSAIQSILIFTTPVVLHGLWGFIYILHVLKLTETGSTIIFWVNIIMSILSLTYSILGKYNFYIRQDRHQNESD